MSPRKTRDNPLGLEPEAYLGRQAITRTRYGDPWRSRWIPRSARCGYNPARHARQGAAGRSTVYAVLQLSKLKWRFEPAKNHDGLKRVDIFKVDGAAIVDADMALGAVEEQRERVQTGAR